MENPGTHIHTTCTIKTNAPWNDAYSLYSVSKVQIHVKYFREAKSGKCKLHVFHVLYVSLFVFGLAMKVRIYTKSRILHSHIRTQTQIPIAGIYLAMDFVHLHEHNLSLVQLAFSVPSSIHATSPSCARKKRSEREKKKPTFAYTAHAVKQRFIMYTSSVAKNGSGVWCNVKN